MSARPFFVAAGGTGGHMFPALALADALSALGHAVILLTDQRGARYLKGDRAFRLISAKSPSGSLASKLAGLASLAVGFVQCCWLVQKERPRALACFGGYAAAPAAMAAALFNLPLLVHEQNAVFGRANRLAARFAEKIALSFRATSNLPDKPTAYTGNPVRPGFAAADSKKPGSQPELSLLIMGGSQGARVLSDEVPAALAALSDDLRARLTIQQQCRAEDMDRVRQFYDDAGMRAELASFFEDVPTRLAMADLVITRSGASTIGELLQLGRPALLVPYKFAADGHQLANAKALRDAGAAIVVEQDEFESGKLTALLEDLLGNPVQLAVMGAAAAALSTPNAARDLARLSLEISRP